MVDFPGDMMDEVESRAIEVDAEQEEVAALQEQLNYRNRVIARLISLIQTNMIIRSSFHAHQRPGSWVEIHLSVETYEKMMQTLEGLVKE